MTTRVTSTSAGSPSTSSRTRSATRETGTPRTRSPPPADNLTKYLNLAAPLPDDECRACVWLPHCAGGCPNRRLAGSRPCVAYRDDPESFVLALHARIGEKGDAACGSKRSLLPDE